MAFVVTQFPEWSWSHSRDQMFQECNRKYYYHYYGSHNGWLRDAPIENQRLYRLKQLTNLYLYLGDVVHQLAEMSIHHWEKKREVFTEEQLLHRLRNLMNQAFLQSKDMETWWESPKKRTMLSEMYYERELPKKVVEEIKERMQVCVAYFLRCESLQDVILNPAYRLAEIEELQTIQIEGQKVYVKLDALYHSEAEDKWVIIDWKTGKEEEAIEDQLRLYAYYLVETRGVPLEKIEIRTEYLMLQKCKKDTVSEEGLVAIAERVRESAASMKGLLADPAGNEPLPMQSFPGARHPLSCRWCQYRQVCDVKQQ